MVESLSPYDRAQRLRKSAGRLVATARCGIKDRANQIRAVVPTASDYITPARLLAIDIELVLTEAGLDQSELRRLAEALIARANLIDQVASHV